MSSVETFMFVLCFASVLDVSHTDADDIVCYLAVDIVASSDVFFVYHFFLASVCFFFGFTSILINFSSFVWSYNIFLWCMIYFSADSVACYDFLFFDLRHYLLISFSCSCWTQFFLLLHDGLGWFWYGCYRVFVCFCGWCFGLWLLFLLFCILLSLVLNFFHWFFCLPFKFFSPCSLCMVFLFSALCQSWSLSLCLMCNL